MSDSPFFEYWKHFHAVSESHNLSSFARLIYYRLLEEFNKKHWELTEIQLTDRDVQRMTNIRSLKSIVDAKSELNRVNLMRITNRKNKPTIYELLSPTNRNKHEISTKQARNKHEISTAFIKYTQNKVQEDKEEEKEARAHARATDEDSTPKSQLNPRIALEYAEVFNLGQKPSGGLAFRLIDLQNKYGVQKMLDAIQKARFSKKPKVILEGEEKLPVIEGLSPNYLVSILEDKKTTKGASNYGERKSHHNADEHKSPYDDL